MIADNNYVLARTGSLYLTRKKRLDKRARSNETTSSFSIKQFYLLWFSTRREPSDIGHFFILEKKWTTLFSQRNPRPCDTAMLRGGWVGRSG